MDNKLIKNSTLSFIPGPESIDYIEDSQNIQEIAEYPVFDLIKYLLTLENVRVLRDGGDDVYLWQLIREKDDRSIIINFTTLNGGKFSFWGGSGLVLNCSVSDVVNLWEQIRQKFKAVWIHDDNCTVYTVEAFITKFKI